MALVGLKNIYYAVITVGTDGKETYGTPKKIGEAVSVDINPETESVSLYGDDMAVATDNSTKEIKVTIETTDIPLEDLATLLGHTYSSTDKTLTAKMSDVAPYVGLLFESQKSTGGVRCAKLMKGKFAPTSETINTKGERTEYQTPSLEGTFVANAAGVWKITKDFDKGADTTTWYESM